MQAVGVRALLFAALTLSAAPCAAAAPGEDETVAKALYASGVMAAMEIACKLRDTSDFAFAKVFLGSQPGGFTGSRYTAAFAQGLASGGEVEQAPDFPAICATAVPKAIKALRAKREALMRAAPRAE